MTRQLLPIVPHLVSPSRRGGGSGEPAPHPVPLASEPDGPWLLDSREVARLLGISRTKAFQLMSTGVVPVVRIGRCARVPRSDLGVWINAQTVAPRQVS
ncbi:MAG: helix-turn-helix domain-containing protein [Candidatus Acidiferrales bacterium]